LASIALAVALLGLSCERADRVAPPPQTEPSAWQSSGEEGGEEPEIQVTVIELPYGVVPDSIGLLPCSLVVWQRDDTETEGDDDETPTVPEPEEFVSWVLSAYNQRNAAMLSVILADEFVCTEITPDGERSWDKDMEIWIHERMFDPNCEVKPIEDVGLELANVTFVPPPGDPQDPAGVWTVRCDAHLVLDYVSAEDGVWEFLGPAEFLIRANPDSPCDWELVAWHDQLPYD
jgi:hypothetical protein